MTLDRLGRLEIGLWIAGWLGTGLSFGTRSIPVLEIACFALGLAGVARIAKLVLDRDRYWSLCTIFAGAMMPSYFIGAAITLAQYDPNSPLFALPGGDAFLGNALLAILYASLFYWVLVALAPIETRFWRDSLRYLHSPAAWREDEKARPVILAGLIAMIVAEAYLILTGGVTLSGIDVSQDTRLPVGAELVISFSDPILAISAWIIGRWRRPFGEVRLAMLTSALQVVWLGGLGRRVLLYGAVVFLSFFFWSRGKRKSNRVIMLAIPVLGVVYIFSKIFVAMRYASYSYGDVGGGQSLGTLYSDAFSLLSTDADLVNEAEKENYASRFFILGHLTTSMSGLSLTTAQFGKFLVISILTCIPSALFPGKTDLMARYNWGGDGKALLNDLLGLPQLDTAWTPLVAAYGDFLWLGAFLYPLLMLLMGWAFSRLVATIRYPSLVVGSLGLCFMEFIATEAGMSSYFLVGRTLAFLWLISHAIRFFQPATAVE